MRKADIRQITTTRFAKWAEVMVYSHATPIMTIGVGHDEQEGELHFCVPKGLFVEQEEICDVLLRAIDIIREGKAEVR